MASNEYVRVEIAFDGGQIIQPLFTAAAADDLERELASSHDGALTLDASDGRYLIPLRRVVYAKRFARESRVGFGNA